MLVQSTPEIYKRYCVIFDIARTLPIVIETAPTSHTPQNMISQVYINPVNPKTQRNSPAIIIMVIIPHLITMRSTTTYIIHKKLLF